MSTKYDTIAFAFSAKLLHSIIVFIVVYLIVCVFSFILFILQIVGSAPGFPHGIIDPIVVCSLCLVSLSCFLYAGTKTIDLTFLMWHF